MKKVIVMVRTSTDTQQVEDQHNEMVEFCRTLGYSDDQMVFVETQGASAGKVDDDYLDMIETVKENILNDKDIDCFAVWHLNRAVRNEKVYVDLKDFLIKHNVQFICKNPYLKLLNSDGSVNMGMELAFSLMATLAKQDNEERIAKFKRAKQVMRSQGKFTGGTVKYGYKVDDRGFLVIDEEAAQFIRLVFSLYSTGEYSVRTLYEDLKERGYDISYHTVNNIIADRVYIDGLYPQIVSNELWDKCEDVRKNNVLSIPKGRKYCFGSGVFKCSVCGRSMVAEGDQYRCWHHNKYAAPPHCDNSLTIRVDNLDGLLWFVATQEETKYRMRKSKNKTEDYIGKIKVLEEKISATKKKLGFVEEKKKRIIELYVEGVIDKEEKEKKLYKTSEQVKAYNDTLLSYSERIEALQKLLDSDKEENITEDKLKNIYLGVLEEADLKNMQEMVRKHIRKVTSSASWFGKERNKRAVRQNAQLITIETTLGEVKKFIYVARKYKGHYFWVYDDSGREYPLFSVKKIVRDNLNKNKHIDPRAFKKLSEW